ncbi:hypothetical protein KAR91_35300 [Candidatus Pacearchaeota archaeon]|nr:hypothetical protein [Candidatus Pacearchaeota archaeon]
MKTEKGNRSCLVKEISKYIYDGFQLIQQCGTLEKVFEFVDRSLHRIVYMRRDGELVGVAAFMMITDTTLQKIISNEINLRILETFKEVEKEEGENLHVFAIRAEGMKLILNGTRDVIKNLNPKTISWIKPGKTKCCVIHTRK